MSAVSEIVVREFFEHLGCFVRQQRKFVGKEDDEIDFLVLNPRCASRTAPLPFELSSNDIERIDLAVVSVRGWHTETFTPGVLASTPELFRFVEPVAIQQAGKTFSSKAAPLRILVTPSLSSDPDTRSQSIAYLKSRDIDAVLPFRVALSALVDAVETNRNYQKSDLLQVLRLLKLYGLIRDSQLELFSKSRRKPRRRVAP